MRGNWCMHDQEIKMWVDINSLVTGVTLEVDRDIVEDVCCLHPDGDLQHINLAKDTVLRSINLALLWKATVLHLLTNSACVHWWISDTCTWWANVGTKPVTEMLIRCQLSTLEGLAKEYSLTINVTLVKSSAD